MNNLTRITIVFMFLFIPLYYISEGECISAVRGDFVVLGETTVDEEGNDAVLSGMVMLYPSPVTVGSQDTQSIQIATLKSGTVVLVLEKIELETGNLYQVSTVGRGGGIIGWVGEDYIYEITAAPEE